MRKKLLILFLLALAFGQVRAQTQTQKPNDFHAVVQVDSAFARALPTEEADAVASLFRDEPLEVVSRNLDGSWFEVKRPGRLTNLGWVFNKLIDWDFKPEALPLG